MIVEPVLQDNHPPGPNAAMFSSIRRDDWDSREIAEKQIGRNAFFQAMDPRVLKKYLQFALRDTDGGRVRLTTPKAQEAWSYVRPNFQPLSEDTTEGRNQERLVNPEYIPFSRYSKAVWTRPEGVLTLQGLPSLRPRTLFVYGDFSHINYEEIREIHTKLTGTGHGGNGARLDGGTEERVLEDVSHLCCFERPDRVAKTCLEWLDRETLRWKDEQQFWATFDAEKSKSNRSELSNKWLLGVKEDADVKRPINKTSKL